MKTKSRLINKSLSIPIIVIALLMIAPIKVQAYTFSWLISQPGMGGYWGAVSSGYIYRPDYGRVDAYNLGYLNYISQSPLYSPGGGYYGGYNFAGLGSLLSIGN